MNTFKWGFLAFSLLAAGCADDPAPRYAVQADVIAKSDLDGVWYFRQTVVGVPFTTGFTFIGEQGDNELEKIRWDVQEEVLTARRSYEFVRGSEAGEPSQADPYLGAPVAAFKIKSHFDIVRDYNASTGEELNKIVENQERKWYERKFMHVDWSQNLVSNFEFLADFDHGGISAIKQDPAPYFVSDPKDPDHLRLERPSAKEPANYLEVTQKIVASPESVDFEDETNVPLCFLEYSTQDCASQEIKIRNSFLRADMRDYDPLDYDDHMMERFGYFTTDRARYNRQYGETESGRVRLLNRFNIWQHNLAKGSCYADTDCGDVSQSGLRCNKAVPDAAVDPTTGTVAGRCTLPYAVRNLADPADASSKDLGPRQIVYYMNEAMPADLVPSVQTLVNEYDDTLRGIYKTLTGKEAPGPIFLLCPNNPVKAGDPAACGAAGTNPRIGDLRYSMIYWVDEPNSARLLGYGPSSHDPETGETISASAFIYGAAVDEYSAGARDIVRLINGEIPPDDFVVGANVKAWIASNTAGTHGKTFSQAEVDQMGSWMDLGWTRALPKTPAIHKAPARKMAEMARARSAALAQSQVLGAAPGLAAGRLAKMRGTSLERQLINGEILLARGLDPNSAKIDPAAVRPLSLVNPETSRFMKRERRRLGKKGVDLAETFDDAILGFAMQQQGKDSNDVWRIIRETVFRSTAEHETGHTLGLRHNFAGSFDAMNYPKTYWDLRTANGHVPRPRYLDPETDAEKQGVTTADGLQAGISEFQYSSIMDYGAKFNTDIQGIGKYDRAAIKFGYGQIVEVFNDVKDKYLVGALQATVTFGQPQPLLVDCSGDNNISVHYTKLPSLVNLEDRRDVEFSKITNSEVVSNCTYPDSVDHDDQNRLVVPYHFCSDEFEGASPDCNMFDRGPDVYEIAENAIDTYRNYYLFNNFKRDRLAWGPDGYLERIYERYLDPLRSQMQFYVLFRGDYADILPDDGKPDNFWRSPDGWGAYTVAVTEGFNLLGEILTTPTPGPYYKYTQETLLDGPQNEAYQQDDYGVGDPAFTLSIPDARFFSTEWDYDSGYFWYERVSHIGSFLDKVAALSQLTDPETYFLGVDSAADVRQYSINYYRLYPKQMENVWGAALTDRWDRLAPLWTGTAVQKRPISDPIVIAKDGSVPIDPQIGFSVELYAAALGIALIPATYDQSFLDSSRVFLQGNGQQVAVDPSRATITFSDPYSGKIYSAISSNATGDFETGIGARMLDHAKQLKKALDKGDISDATLQSYMQVIDVVRSLTTLYSDDVQPLP